MLPSNVLHDWDELSLFVLTEGRAYSAAECRTWLRDAGLVPAQALVPTRAHCAALVANKR